MQETGITIMQGYRPLDDAEFLCIGQLRKGSPKTQGRMGRDLTYFRAAFFEGEEASAILFREKYGEKPTAIPITFPFAEPQRVWSYGLEAYTGSGVRVMLVDADTNQVQYWFDPSTGEVIVRNGLDIKGNPLTWDGHTPAYTYTSKKGEIKHVLPTLNCRLRVMVPELQRVVYMLVVTRSWNDKKNISRQLAAFYALRGSLKGIPLLLRRRPQEILTSRPDGRKFRETKHLISIESTAEFAAALFREMTAEAMPGTPVISEPPGEKRETKEEPRATAAETPDDMEDLKGDPLIDLDGLSLKDHSFHEAAKTHLHYADVAQVVDTLTGELGQGWARFELRDLWQTLQDLAPEGTAPAAPEASEEKPRFSGLKLEDLSFHQAAMDGFGFVDEEAVETFLEDKLGIDWRDNPVEVLWGCIETIASHSEDAPSPPEKVSDDGHVAVPDFVADLHMEDDSFYQKAKDVFGFDDPPSVAVFLLDELGRDYYKRHTIAELWLYIDATYRESSDDKAEQSKRCSTSRSNGRQRAERASPLCKSIPSAGKLPAHNTRKETSQDERDTRVQEPKSFQVGQVVVHHRLHARLRRPVPLFHRRLPRDVPRGVHFRKLELLERLSIGD